MGFHLSRCPAPGSSHLGAEDSWTSLVAGLQQSEHFAALFPWTPFESALCRSHECLCPLYAITPRLSSFLEGVKRTATTKIAFCQRCCLCIAWAFWDRIFALFVSSWQDLTSAVIASRKIITGPLSHSDYKSHIFLLLYICIYMWVCRHGFMCTSLGITYSMSMFIYIYICIKFRFLYKLSKWKSIIFIIISVFSRWEMLKWIQQNLWLMKHHQFQLPNRYKFHGSNVIMKTWKGRKIAEMWEESSSGNHVQFELFTFSQDRLNSKTKKSYLWAARDRKSVV